jgi:uncharacterized protein (DUF1778 family)
MKNTQSQTKSVRFSFRMTAEEQRLLAETAEKLNVKPSDVARFAINAASIATNYTLQAV